MENVETTQKEGFEGGAIESPEVAETISTLQRLKDKLEFLKLNKSYSELTYPQRDDLYNTYKGLVNIVLAVGVGLAAKGMIGMATDMHLNELDHPDTIRNWIDMIAGVMLTIKTSELFRKTEGDMYPNGGTPE